ncbi:MAG: hypothetical protein U9N12_05920, partial [Euryarchaeota archaeon]|nr:hypothetical protein [Euryarchaeota archaeon]
MDPTLITAPMNGNTSADIGTSGTPELTLFIIFWDDSKNRRETRETGERNNNPSAIPRVLC